LQDQINRPRSIVVMKTKWWGLNWDKLVLRKRTLAFGLARLTRWTVARLLGMANRHDTEKSFAPRNGQGFDASTVQNVGSSSVEQNLMRSENRRTKPYFRLFLLTATSIALLFTQISPANSASPTSHTFCGTQLSKPLDVGITNTSGYPVRSASIGADCNETFLADIAVGASTVVTTMS
jgi:hypothetical protein